MTEDRPRGAGPARLHAVWRRLVRFRSSRISSVWQFFHGSQWWLSWRANRCVPRFSEFSRKNTRHFDSLEWVESICGCWDVEKPIFVSEY